MKWFCCHIWKAISGESLGYSYTYVAGGIRYYATAVTYRCLKCGKEKITKEDRLKL